VIVRRSQAPPQPAPKTSISLAWPSGITSPAPHATSGKSGQVMLGWNAPRTSSTRTASYWRNRLVRRLAHYTAQRESGD
jgi:hypothetical protein